MLGVVRTFLPRLTRRARRGLCLLLAAVLALAPVVSTVAQAHEASHAVQGEQHFHEHDARGTTATAGLAIDADDMSDSAALLHVLTHAAHGCAHAVAILGGAAAAIPCHAPAILLPESHAAPGDAPRVHPFRPPIG